MRHKYIISEHVTNNGDPLVAKKKSPWSHEAGFCFVGWGSIQKYLKGMYPLMSVIIS